MKRIPGFYSHGRKKATENERKKGRGELKEVKAVQGCIRMGVKEIWLCS